MTQALVGEVTPEARPFWDGCARQELWIPNCGRCARYFFYPRVACPHCGWPDQVEWRQVSGRATLHSYVISHLPSPAGDLDVPFVIATVELAEGPRMLTNIVGVAPTPQALRIDMALVVGFDTRQDLTVPVFRPDGGNGS